MGFDFGKFLFGGKDKFKQRSSKSKTQRTGIDEMSQTGGLQDSELYGGGSDFLMKLFGGDFSAFEQPLMNQFEQQIAPGIAERYAGMGAGSSSGLNQSLAQAGENLSTQLGAQRSQLMMQALPQALGYAQQPIENMQKAQGMDQYQAGNFVQEGEEGQMQNIMKMIMMMIGG